MDPDASDFSEGLASLERGELEEALRKLRHVIAATPDHAEAKDTLRRLASAWMLRAAANPPTSPAAKRGCLGAVQALSVAAATRNGPDPRLLDEAWATLALGEAMVDKVRETATLCGTKP